MPLTAYPGLLSGNGKPYMNTARLWTPGDIFFVDSNNGSDSNDGRDPLRPRATFANTCPLRASGGKMRASRGDIVVGMPGHSETIAAAAGLVFDAAGVSLIGLGRGNDRPVLSFTATGSDVDIDAASIYWENIRMTGDIDAVTAAVDVNASDFHMRGCEWRDVTGQVTDFLLTDANADRLLIEDFNYIGALAAVSAASGTNSAIVLVGCDHPVIRNSNFMGAFGIAAIECRTTAVVYMEAHDLRIVNFDNRAAGTAGVGIEDVVTGSTGLVGPNLMIHMETDGANITEAVTGATFRYVDPIYIVNADNEKAILTNIGASTD